MRRTVLFFCVLSACGRPHYRAALDLSRAERGEIYLDRVTQEEAVALLDYVKQRQLAGCAGDAACAVDIGRALEAEHIVHGTVGRVGELFVFSASLVKMPEGSVQRRVSEQAEGERGLVDRVHAAADALAAP
jgi:hypothetical protein